MIPHTQRHQSGFTLIELLGAMLIISTALLSIFTLLRVAIDFTNKSRQETIAINLAREGVESVYQRRNTNRLKWSSERDRNWLRYEDNNPNRFQGSQLYTINNNLGSFSKAEELTIDGSILRESFIVNNANFLGGQSPDAAARFYRAIVGVGLYQKDTNRPGGNLILCDNGDDTYNGINIIGNDIGLQDCSDSRPKEFQFCSKVEYEKNEQTGQVELCAAITNYRQ